MNISNILLDQSNAIRTPVLPEVKTLIDTVIPNYDGVKKYQTNIKEWLKPIVDLTDFYVYPTNGITEGLNWWYNRERRNVLVDSDEYQWLKSKDGIDSDIRYQSVPGCSTGNFIPINLNSSVALDLAYVGSTAIKKIELGSNVEFVFYSISKSFGVRNIRTGWLFTRKPEVELSKLIYDAKYYNYYANDISEAIISQFDIDYVFNRLRKQQLDRCVELDFNPSDSVWLATTHNELYRKFFKKDKIARICLSKVYNYDI